MPAGTNGRSPALAIAFAASLAFACAAITGIDDLSEGSSSGDGSSGGGHGDGGSGPPIQGILPDGAVCGDITSDRENCGSCGHSCRGGTCVDRACAPINVASSQPRPDDVVVADGTVYFNCEGIVGATGVIRAVRPLEDPVDLATGQGVPLHLFFLNGGLFWTDWYDPRSIQRLDVASGTITSVVTGLGGSDGLATNGSRLVWTLNPLGAGLVHHVYASTMDGGALTDYASSDSGASFGGPVIAGNGMFWSEVSSSGRILRAAAGDTAGKSTVFASKQPNPNALAADDTYLYWAVHGPVGMVVRQPLAGGAASIVIGSLGAVGRIAVDDTNVYAVDLDGSKIISAPKAGGAITTLASGQTLPHAIYADGTFVYWTVWGTNNGDDGNGAVWKVARP